MYVMAIPIIQNKVPAWKAWIRELTESRKEEFETFNERMELTLHRVWLTQGREGPLAIVVIDGPGAKDYPRNLASSKEPFDQWFRERATEYHGVDLSKLDAVPQSEMYLDWHAPSYADVGR